MCAVVGSKFSTGMSEGTRMSKTDSLGHPLRSSPVPFEKGSGVRGYLTKSSRVAPITHDLFSLALIHFARRGIQKGRNVLEDRLSLFAPFRNLKAIRELGLKCGSGGVVRNYCEINAPLFWQSLWATTSPPLLPQLPIEHNRVARWIFAKLWNANQRRDLSNYFLLETADVDRTQ